jgi:hypothetical protein
MWPLLTPAALLNDLFGVPALLRLAAHRVLGAGEWEVLQRPRRRRPADVAWTEADVALLDEANVHLGRIPARRVRRAEPTTDEEAMIERTLADVGPVDTFMRAHLRDHLSEWTRGDDGEDDADPTTRTFGHVLIDEAQDLSVMQARMVGRRAPGGSMTILGDLGQGSSDHAARGWNDILDQLPGRHEARIVELSVNYRTPAEVMDLASRVLAASTPDLTAPRSVRSTGEPPTVTRVSPGPERPGQSGGHGPERPGQSGGHGPERPGRSGEHGALVDGAATAARGELELVGGGRLAVIAPEAIVEAVRAALDAPDFGSRALEQPLAVYTVGGVKGLEFDAVVVVEPAHIVAERRNGMRALYVALTRTTGRLHLVHEAPLPAPLAEAVTDHWSPDHGGID